MPSDDEASSWRRELTVSLIGAGISGHTLRRWGFYTFLEHDIPQCANRRDAAVKLFCDLMSNEGGPDAFEDIYIAVTDFVGGANVHAEAKAGLYDLVTSPYPPERFVLVEWFDTNIPERRPDSPN